MRYYQLAIDDLGHEGYFELDDANLAHEHELTASEIDAVIHCISWWRADEFAHEYDISDLTEGEAEDWYATEAERFYFDLWDDLMSGERLYF